MIEQMRREIEVIEESANRLKKLAEDNPAIKKNAETILTFVYLLKFITPEKVKEENGWKRSKEFERPAGAAMGAAGSLPMSKTAR
jgi:hypothetical protein